MLLVDCCWLIVACCLLFAVVRGVLSYVLFVACCAMSHVVVFGVCCWLLLLARCSLCCLLRVQCYVLLDVGCRSLVIVGRCVVVRCVLRVVRCRLLCLCAV